MVRPLVLAILAILAGQAVAVLNILFVVPYGMPVFVAILEAGVAAVAVFAYFQPRGQKTAVSQ